MIVIKSKQTKSTKNKHNTLTTSKHFLLILCLGLVDLSILRSDSSLFRACFSSIVSCMSCKHNEGCSETMMLLSQRSSSQLFPSHVAKVLTSVNQHLFKGSLSWVVRLDAQGLILAKETASVNALLRIQIIQPHLHFLHFLGPSLLPPCFYSSDLANWRV